MVENKSPKDEILFCTPVYVALMKLNIKAPDVVEKICIAEKKSLQEQEGKDVFEYSVFGSPQQKIGDFTQTKIGGFS